MTLNLTDIEQIAAETALKAWNGKTHYSKFSRIISKGFQAQRDAIVGMVEKEIEKIAEGEAASEYERGYDNGLFSAKTTIIKVLQSPTEKSGASLRSFDPAIEDLSGYYATPADTSALHFFADKDYVTTSTITPPTDTEKGWEDRFDELFDKPISDAAHKHLVNTHSRHIFYDNTSIKSFIAIELTRARNEALEEAAKAITWEIGGERTSQIRTTIRSLISKDDTTQV